MFLINMIKFDKVLDMLILLLKLINVGVFVFLGVYW